MISLGLAQKLKISGLIWNAAKHDSFVIPDRGMDDLIFVLSDMAVFIEKIRGRLTVTFHGTPEWALDDILVSEVIWLPNEAQLRELLEMRLVTESQPAFKLMNTADGYLCEIKFQGQAMQFEAFGASDAYGLALLHCLENEASKLS